MLSFYVTILYYDVMLRYYVTIYYVAIIMLQCYVIIYSWRRQWNRFKSKIWTETLN